MTTLNGRIIELFTLLIKQMKDERMSAQMENDIKEIKRHDQRIIHTKNALNIIKNFGKEITSDKDLDNIPGLGKGTKNRVKEILETGDLSELDKKYTKTTEQNIKGMNELTQVIGIGEKTAQKLITNYGIKSVKDLIKAHKNKKIKLSEKILLGLKYYGVVEQNIPRKEITSVSKYLQSQLESIDPDLELTICGSYRRGKATSGDIDVLIYHPEVVTEDDVTDSDYLELFVEELTNEGFLLDHMTDKNYVKKYMGFCQYRNNPVRRIDIRFVPYESLGSALLYFTGPMELNTEMRKQAKKRNMILNEYGLYKIRKAEQELIPTETEEDIFKALGMKYLTPVEREGYSAGK